MSITEPGVSGSGSGSVPVPRQPRLSGCLSLPLRARGGCRQPVLYDDGDMMRENKDHESQKQARDERGFVIQWPIFSDEMPDGCSIASRPVGWLYGVWFLGKAKPKGCQPILRVEVLPGDGDERFLCVGRSSRFGSHVCDCKKEAR